MVAKSRYARMHKVSHTKPLHDATAQMTDEAVTHRPQTTTIAMDAKPTKHTQTLAIRKASGIVRFLKGWCGARDGAKKAVTVGVAAAVKHSCITFNECRKLNIKNPLFT